MARNSARSLVGLESNHLAHSAREGTDVPYRSRQGCTVALRLCRLALLEDRSRIDSTSSNSSRSRSSSPPPSRLTPRWQSLKKLLAKLKESRPELQSLSVDFDARFASQVRLFSQLSRFLQLTHSRLIRAVTKYLELHLLLHPRATDSHHRNLLLLLELSLVHPSPTSTVRNLSLHLPLQLSVCMVRPFCLCRTVSASTDEA